MRNKKIYALILVIFTCFSIFSMQLVYAEETVEDTTAAGDLGDGFNPSIISGLTNSNSDMVFKRQVYRVWNTVKVIIWVLCVAGILFAGVKYIFAGIDAKSEIKQGLIKIVVGIVLVFSSSLVIDIIINIFTDVTNVTK